MTLGGVSIRRSLVTGAFAGTVATLPMSALMLAAQRAGLLTQQTPERITELSIERTAELDVEGRRLDALAAVAHLGFGAAAGALFAVIVGRRFGAPVAGVVGIGYGLLIWLVAYKSTLPKIDLMPPPSLDQRRRPETMIAAHIVFGGVLGTLTALLGNREGGR